MEVVEKLLSQLDLLNKGALREKWGQIFGSPPSSALSEKLLRLGLGYRIQVLEHGAGARCAAIRRSAREQRSAPRDDGHGYTQGFAPGTRLLREYGGRMHEVLAIEFGRFVYEGQVFKSLTEVSRKITGTPRSGAIFFGLRKKAGQHA